MTARYSYEYVKNKFEIEGYKLLSQTYLNSHTKMKIRCPEGHIFYMRRSNFQQGQRCPECQHPSKKLSYELVKEKIEKEGYELLSKKYKGNKSYIEVKCPEGHIFKTIYNSFQQGQRCPKCKYIEQSNKQKYSIEFVKSYIEEHGYELLSTSYINSHERIKVKCNKGHEYYTCFHWFKNGNNRCLKCSNRISKPEKELSKYLKSLNLKLIRNDRSIISPLELDIVIPEKRMAIEYCGLYWHSEENIKNKNYHLNKLKLCEEKGYRLITIFEDEWINKENIVKSRLKHILKLDYEKVYARNCEIKEIDSKKAKEFIDKHHIQGYQGSKIKLGAFHKNTLVAVMTFSKPSLAKGRKDQDSDIYEISRFCSSINVIGIAGKLLKYFQRNYEYKGIYTFADRRWSEGKLYENLGFEKLYNTKPNYYYFKTNQKRFHRFQFRKDVLNIKLEVFDPDKTEYENMLINGWNRIWDCGNVKLGIINEKEKRTN